MLLVSALWRGFRRKRRGYRRILREFNRALLLIQDRRALEAAFSARVQELLPIRSLVLFHSRPESDRFWPGYTFGLETPDLAETGIERRGRLARWLLVNETGLLLPLSSEVLEHLEPEACELLQSLDTHLCMPLLTQGKLVGILLLTLEDPTHLPGPQEREILELLAQQGALGLENALLYEQERSRLQRLHRTERLAAMGHLAAGAAHEIRNPLTAIRSTMQYLARGMSDDDQRQMVDELLAEVDRINETVNDLLQLTREGSFEPVALEPVRAVDQAAALIEAQAERQGVSIHRSYPEEAPAIRADPDQVRQLLLNLLLNALQAMPAGGKLTLRVEALDGMYPASDEWIQIVLVDTGTGIQPEEMEKIFDPFYTTKNEGTGLGLAVSHRIVERHGGELQLESEPGRGTTVYLRLPVSPWPES
jgi:signal transduction histidine kinase